MEFYPEFTTSSGLTPQPEPPASTPTHRYTKEEWNVYKHFIEELYPTKGMTAKKIIEMLRDRGFQVNERLLKRKVQDWKLDKNVKGKEMDAIVRKQKRRMAKGKDTTFRVRGQPVQQEKIERWKQRTGNNVWAAELDALDSPVPSTPTLSVISYNTPSAMSQSSPTIQSIGMASPIFFSHPMNRMTPSQDETSGNVSRPQGMITSPNFRVFWDVETIDDTNSAPHLPVGHSNNTEIMPCRLTPPAGITDSQAYQRLFENYIAKSLNNAPLHISFGSGYLQLDILQPSGVKYLQKEEKEARQRLHASRETHGVNHPATWDFMNSLARILNGQGQYNSAEELYRSEVFARELNFGGGDLDTLQVLLHLANTCAWQQKYSEAIQICEYVRMKVSKHLPQYHPLCIEAALTYGIILLLNSKLLKAELLLREVVSVGGSSLPVDHPLLLRAFRVLTSLLMGRSEFLEAERILRQVILSLALGKHEGDLLLSQTSLGELLIFQGRYEAAEEILQKVLEIQIKSRGPEHQDTLRTQVMIALAGSYASMDDTKLRHVCDKAEKVFGKLHQYYLYVRYKLARLLCHKNRYDEAAPILEEVLLDCEKIDGGGKRWKILSEALLGDAYNRQGRLQKASVMYERAVIGSGEVFGDENLYTKRIVARYNDLKKRLEMEERFWRLEDSSSSS